MHRDLTVVFLFSGQGSHYRGMGIELFQQHAVFKRSMEECDAIMRRHLQVSLIDELYYNNSPDFTELIITHPAIVAVELSMFRIMEQLGVKADITCGNSLGEFAAAAACGIWSPETAMEAAIEQAKAITRNNTEGGMMAVNCTRDAAIDADYTKFGLYLSSDNFNGHFSVAGTKADLQAYKATLVDKNTFPLAVSYPFHSPLLDPAKQEFMYYMHRISPLAAPSNTFISGVECVLKEAVRPEYFWQAVSQYSSFPKLIQYIEQWAPCLYIDLGPSGSAATFAKYSLSAGSGSYTFPLMTPYKNEMQRLGFLETMFEIKRN